MLRAYYQLTKPGIIYGNMLPTIAGFLFASQRHIHWTLLLQTVVGLALVIASACVYNNVIDRDIDKKMARTKRRPLVRGSIRVRAALIYATVVGIIGFAALFGTNWVAFSLAVLGFVVYVGVYAVAKRASPLGTIVGSISGAVPPAIGYTAVRGDINSSAVILFAILVCWQMPHFYAIALYRLKDYTAVQIPVLPAKKGPFHTKVQMTVFASLFIVASLALAIYDAAGWLYAITAAVLSIGWLIRITSGFWRSDTAVWARQVFLDSLTVLTLLCVMIGLSPWLV
jgi:protoheme IX farnesyltransferase